jgi:Predicted transcriptional regulator
MYNVQPDILNLSKALGEDTRFAIFREIAGAEKPQTVRDLVRTFGMHHSAVRIHLNRLHDAGLIISKPIDRRGTVGRPQLVYLPNPTATSLTLPPRNFELLARMALEFALASAGTDLPAEEFATSWGNAYIRDGGQAGTHLSLPEALDALVDELRGMGGSPMLAQLNGDGYALVEHNCLFGDVSSRYEPLVCSLHQGAIRGMLQELCAETFEWTMRETLAAGAERCCATIQRQSARPA